MRHSYKFVFVGGCGRSGTSLVQKLLVAHSRVAGGPEFDQTEEIVSLCFKMIDNGDRLAYFVSSAEIAHAFRQLYRSFFENILSDDCIYVSEKTPRNIRVADKLLTLFPDSRFIHVIRDGRDVLASYLDVRRRYQEAGHDNPSLNTSRIYRMWNDAVDMHFRIAEAQQVSPRYHAIRFEQLLTQPCSVITDLCGFLGLAFEDRLLCPELITAAETGMRVGNFFYPEEMYQQPFNPARIGRWRTDLPLRERFAGFVKLRSNLKRLGYT